MNALRNPLGVLALVASVCPACTTPHSGRAPVGAAQQRVATKVSSDAPTYAFTDPDRIAKIRAALPDVERVVQEEADKMKLTGLALGVIVDGELVSEIYLGLANKETQTPVSSTTVFRIGSITKTFTALAILKLRDEGKLDLDRPVSQYLPEMGEASYPSDDSTPITLRQLLAHNSGLPRLGDFDYTRPDRDLPESELLQAIRSATLVRAPGTAYEYSNLGYSILGLVVSRASKVDYGRYIESQILQPLGMTSSGFDRGPQSLAVGYRKDGTPGTRWRLGASGASGALDSTLRDMARYSALQLAAYPPRNGPDNPLVRRATLREMHGSGQLLGIYNREDPSIGTTKATAMGFSWQVIRGCNLPLTVTKNGGLDGWSSEMAFLPSRGIAVVALSNTDEADLGRLRDRVFSVLVKDAASSARRMQPTRELIHAAERLAALQNQWDAHEYESLITEQHRSKPTSKGAPMIDAEREELAVYAKRHGKCTVGPEWKVSDLNQAEVRLRCERGEVLMRFGFASPGRISGFSGESFGLEPSPNVKSAIDATIGLLNVWDDALYQRHYATSFAMPPSDFKKFVTGTFESRGFCEVSKTLASPSEGNFKLLLDCARGAFDLQVTVAPDTAGVTYMTVRKRAETSCVEP